MSCRRDANVASTHPDPSNSAEVVITEAQARRLFWGTHASKTIKQSFSFDDLVQARVTAENVMASRVGMSTLHILGAKCASDLTRLGFTSVHLNDESVCVQAIAVYGLEAVKQTFMRDASDAVAVCGSVFQERAKIQDTDLLELCAGAPQQAASILQHMSDSERMRVTAVTLLDCGVREPTLTSIGITFSELVKRGATAKQLELLGFRMLIRK